jgi:gamma-glutamylcyclotransferase (GGCT)/AIG2-like uncharacterized protein YtfP
MLYFAYGSNMSAIRMLSRKITWTNVYSGTLKDYKLVFNKMSQKNNAVGFANIIPSKGDIVEGVMYELEIDMVKILDKYEGYPKHYNRTLLDIEYKWGEEDAITYIANKEYLREGLKPSKEYMDFILDSKQFLSEKYYNTLKNIEYLKG